MYSGGRSNSTFVDEVCDVFLHTYKTGDEHQVWRLNIHLEADHIKQQRTGELYLVGSLC